MKIRIRLQEHLLGTKSNDPEILKDHVLSKMEDHYVLDREKKALEELSVAEKNAMLKEEVEKRLSVFHRHPDNGHLMLWNYQIKGYLKAAGEAIRQSQPKGKPGGGTTTWGAIQSKVDMFVAVKPRMICLPQTKPDGILPRQLRAKTPQGPRVTLMASEYVKAGTEFDCEIKCMIGSRVTDKMILAMLDYGEEWVGIGQWRNAGWGQFTYEVTEETFADVGREPNETRQASIA